MREGLGLEELPLPVQCIQTDRGLRVVWQSVSSDSSSHPGEAPSDRAALFVPEPGGRAPAADGIAGVLPDGRAAKLEACIVELPVHRRSAHSLVIAGQTESGSAGIVDSGHVRTCA